MCTIKAAIAALERYGGFDPKRCRTISRELINTGVIPMGAPGMAQVLSAEEFLFLFEALAFDPKVREASQAAGRARSLVIGGEKLAPDDPTSLPRSAHWELEFLADMALGPVEDQRIVVARRIEFVSTWPEIAIHTDGKVSRFVEPGKDSKHWQSRGQRRSTTITGGAFVDMLRSLYT